MKLSYLLIFVVILFYSQAVFAVSAVVPTNCVITSTLRVGSRGAEVECLQTKIGVVIDGKFGPATRGAVMLFQAKNHLVDDGIVGFHTFSVLNLAISDTTNNQTGTTNSTIPPVSNSNNNRTPPVVNNNNNTGNVSTNTNVIPDNLVNLDKFIDTVVNVGKKNGQSEQQLTTVASALREKIVNSKIDYKEKFKELLINESKLSANFDLKNSQGFFSRAIGQFLSFVGVTPSVANASAGLPFGGALFGEFFCDVSVSWMLYIEPLPPTYVALLDYVEGTEGFASYNIPFTTFLLGSYSQPGECAFTAGPDIVTIDTEGLILPMTGSSPI